MGATAATDQTALRRGSLEQDGMALLCAVTPSLTSSDTAAPPRAQGDGGDARAGRKRRHNDAIAEEAPEAVATYADPEPPPNFNDAPHE